MKRFTLILAVVLAMAASAEAQGWVGTVPSSRAVDWSVAGLPATYPDGETTTNPYTPPVRTKCGSTLAAGTSAATISSTIAGCANGTYVLLGVGSFSVPSTFINIFKNTLRGSGPMSTFINLTGNSTIQIGAGSGAGSGLVVSGATLSVGTSSIKIGTVSGLTPVVGNVVTLQQCDTGFTGTPCAGSTSDNGGLYVCGDIPSCMTEPSGSSNHNHQSEIFLVTTVVDNGTGAGCGATHCYTLTLDHGLYLPNWSFGLSPTISWQDHSFDAVGAGLEDLTVYSSSVSANCAVNFNDAYGSWVKGVRFVGSGAAYTVCLDNSVHGLLANNYTFSNVAIDSTYQAINQSGSLNLTINNIETSGGYWLGQGGNVASVLAFNLVRDMFTQYTENSFFDHHAFSMLNLEEGNELGVMHEDNTWGTKGPNTYLRNVVLCADTPYTTWNPGPGNYRGIVISGFQRFDNMIGNAVGTTGLCTGYQGSGFTNNFQFDGSDTLATNSLMRWGNTTVVTQVSDTPASSGIRFVSAEAVPATLTGGAAAFQASVPGTTNIGCSYFLAAYTATTCTLHPAGGTGLSFWKVCTAWSIFPTACSAVTTQPFPIAGPDVSGGSYVLGHGYDNPAEVAWKNLPVDTTYQTSYTISGSSWSGGTETLTITPAVSDMTHLMGAFQTSGLNSACTTGATFNANNEILMTGSTTTTIKYALTGNPGLACTGTFKFPDVRKFDESIYQNDVSATPPPAPTPAAFVLNWNVSKTQAVTLSGSTTGNVKLSGNTMVNFSAPVALTANGVKVGTYTSAGSMSTPASLTGPATLPSTLTGNDTVSGKVVISCNPPPAGSTQPSCTCTFAGGVCSAAN